MVNVTLSVDDRVLERARAVAQATGTSLNGLVRRYLEQVAGGLPREDAVREFIELSHAHEGRSRGWRFNRDEIHER